MSVIVVSGSRLFLIINLFTWYVTVFERLFEVNGLSQIYQKGILSKYKKKGVEATLTSKSLSDYIFERYSIFGVVFDYNLFS